MTTIFVTHDQAEAMDVASQIAVMNHGRIEQVGTPTELYDEPATEFVMSFVGEANRLGDGWVRPHELEIAHEPSHDAVEAIDRADHALRLRRPHRARRSRTATTVTVQLTRDRLELLELGRGEIVWVRPDRERVFSEAGATVVATR